MKNAVDFIAVIPARYQSSRLPGKPLLDIAGKPMVVRVAERAGASGAQAVWVATDHEAVAQVVTQHGFNACMTRQDHLSGTDRIAEVATSLKWPEDTIIVNVQGDEPLIEPVLIREVARQLQENPEASMSTACHSIHDPDSVFNPNVVKVVLDNKGFALYFSRAAIPYARDAFAGGKPNVPPGLPVFRHIGIYAYRAGFLRDFTRLNPCPIEQFETLEQLRALWHGYKIAVAVTDNAPASGVDTLEDLQKVRAIIGSK